MPDRIVGMSEDRKKPGVAFWVTVGLVVVLMAYPLSFGPACWAVENRMLPMGKTGRFFRPVARMAIYGPRPLSSMLKWYSELWSEPIWCTLWADCEFP
jgi:hypothetical protein